MNLWHLNNMKIMLNNILTYWTLTMLIVFLFLVLLVFSFPHYPQSSQPILKNLILEFPKNMIKPPLIWLIHLTLQINIWITLCLMKSNSCLPLLNIFYKKTDNKAPFCFNELLLTHSVSGRNKCMCGSSHMYVMDTCNHVWSIIILPRMVGTSFVLVMQTRLSILIT